MSGKLIGSIEHYSLGQGPAGLLVTGSYQQTFISLYNFFNNNTGTMGFQRIAYHTGANGTGMTPRRGMNFYDAPNPAGAHAWACFASLSASVPWYVLFQWSDNTAFGTAPGSPGLVNGVGSTNNIGFTFAQRADGGNPWNGSSGSNGSDTKGIPVWTAGTSSLVIYPRSNDTGGSHVTQKQNCMGAQVGSTTSKWHMMCDYDNFMFLYDGGLALAYNNGVIFGKYDPLTGVNPQVPYFCLGLHNAAVPPAPTTVVGTLAGTAGTEGGISYPIVSISGTRGYSIDYYDTSYFQNATYQPNLMNPGDINLEVPFFFVLNESPSFGYVGQHSGFFGINYNVHSHETNGANSRVTLAGAFGVATKNTLKLTIPWHTGTSPGSYFVERYGIQFSIP